MSRHFYEGSSYQEDYVHITLTDEGDVPEAMARLRIVYHNLMKLDYDNTRTRTAVVIETAQDAENKSPMQLFAEFYEKQNGTAPSEEQNTLLKNLIETIWEDEA
jgi:exonuclease SbcD